MLWWSCCWGRTAHDGQWSDQHMYTLAPPPSRRHYCSFLMLYCWTPLNIYKLCVIFPSKGSSESLQFVLHCLDFMQIRLFELLWSAQLHLEITCHLPAYVQTRMYESSWGELSLLLHLANVNIAVCLLTKTLLLHAKSICNKTTSLLWMLCMHSTNQELHISHMHCVTCIYVGAECTWCSVHPRCSLQGYWRQLQSLYSPAMCPGVQLWPEMSCKASYTSVYTSADTVRLQVYMCRMQMIINNCQSVWTWSACLALQLMSTANPCASKRQEASSSRNKLVVLSVLSQNL